MTSSMATTVLPSALNASISRIRSGNTNTQVSAGIGPSQQSQQLVIVNPSQGLKQNSPAPTRGAPSMTLHCGGCRDQAPQVATQQLLQQMLGVVPVTHAWLRHANDMRWTAAAALLPRYFHAANVHVASGVHARLGLG